MKFENMKFSMGRLVVIIVMLATVIVGGTFAWFTYQSKQSALVLTIGELNDTQITLTPYQINEVMAPGSSYSSGVKSDVNVQVGSNINNSSVVLYYKINDLDTTLINKGLSYTVVKIPTENENPSCENDSSCTVASGKFSDLIDTGEILPEEVVIFNTKATNENYSVYLWVDSKVGNQNDIQNTTLDVELNATIGRVVISGDPTFNQTLTTSMMDMNTEATYTYQWYSNTSNSTTGGTAISGATGTSYKIGSGLVGKYIYVVVSVNDPKQGTKTYSDITSVVKPITGTISLTPIEKIYDGKIVEYDSHVVTTNSDGTVQFTYYKNSSCSTQTSTSDGASASGASPKDAYNYYVKATVVSPTGDYSTASTCVPHTITKKSVSVSWDTTQQSFTYNGGGQAPDASVTITGVYPSESMTLSLGTTKGTNVGSYTSTASCSSVSGGRAKCSNYTLTDVTSHSFDIIKRPLGATVSVDNKIYDGTTTATCNVKLSNVVSGQNPTATATGNFIDPDVGTNKIVTCSNIKLDDTWTKNYSIPDNLSIASTASITKKEIIVPWGSTTSWTYDGNSHIPTVTTPVTGAGSEKVNISVSGAQINVGSYTATASCSSVTGGQAKCTNYTLTSPTKAFTINQDKTATTGSCGTLTYTSSAQTLASGGSFVTYKNNSGTNAGSYTVTVETDANHQFSDGSESKTLSCSIGKKSLTVTWGSTTTFTYSGSNQAPTVTTPVTGVGSEKVNLSVSGAQTNAGSYTATASCSSVTGGQAKCDNYTLTSPTKAFTINQAKTATTGSCGTLTYTGTAQTLASGGSFVTYKNNSGTNAGSYTVTVETDANHQFSDGSESKTLSCSIGQKQLTPSVTASNKTYDSTTSATCNVTLSGAVASQSPTATATGTFADANVGTGKTVTCSSIALGSSWTTNYKLSTTSKTTTANITAKSISVTWGSTTSWTYDGSSHIPTVTTPVTGAGSEKVNISVSGAQINVGSYTATASCSSVTGGQAKCDNYTLTSTTKTFTINQAKTATTGSCGTLTYTSSAQTLASGGSFVTYKNNSGTNAGSYTVTVETDANHQFSDGSESKTLSCSIGKKSLAVTWGSTTTFTYSGSNQAPAVTTPVTGVGSEKVNLSVSGAQTNAGSYTATASCSSVTGGQAKCDNYTLTSTTKTFTINQAKTATTGSCGTLTYTGTAQTLASGGSFVNYKNNSGTNAGSYTVTVETDANHQFSDGSESKTLSCSIGQKQLTPSVTASNKTYDSTTSATCNVTLSGAVASQSPTATATGTFADANVGTGKTVTCSSIALGSSWTTNYKLSTTSKTTTANITAKSISVTWGSTTSWTYDGSSHIPTVTTPATGAGSEKVNISVSGAQTNAGSYTATASCSSVTGGQAKCTNYTLTNTSKAFSINQDKTATTGSCGTLTYTSSAQTLASGGSFVTYKNNSGTNAGSYTVTVETDANHQFSDGSESKTLSCSIGKKSLTVTWGSTTTFTYSGSNQVPTVTTPVTGVGSEKVNLSVSGAQTNAGSYTATASCSSVTGGQAKCDNYTLTSTTKTFTINQAKTATTGSCGTLTYTGTAQTLASGGSFVNYKNNSGTNAGSYTVTVETDANHQFSDGSESKTLSCSIGQKQLTPSVTASNKTYDSTTSATCNVTLSGAVASQSPTATATGTFADANVGTGKTVTCSSIALGSSWTTNYKLSTTSKTTTANITAKSISVTWGSTTSWTYDGSSHIPTVTTPATGAGSEKVNISVSGAQTNVGSYTATASCSSVTGGQAKCTNYTLTNTSKAFSINQDKTATPGSCGALTYTSSAQTLASGGSFVTYKNNSGTNAGSYTVTVETDANHQFSDGSESKTLSCSIGQKQLTPSVTASNKTYDSTTSATCNVTLSGAVASQSPTATATGTFADANVGTGKTVTCSSIALGSSWTTNYKLSTTSKTTTANITAKSISVTWGSTTSWTYDGSSHIPTVTTPATGAGSEKVNISVSGAQTNVGSYTATASCSSVTGGQAKCTNYTLTSASKNFNIIKATPTITTSPTSATVESSQTGTFSATVKSIPNVSGTLTAVSATESIIKITGEGASNTLTSTSSGVSKTITYQGGATEGTSNITLTFTPSDTNNFNTVTKVFAATNDDTIAPTKPTITRTDYNTFSYSSTDGGTGIAGYYVSTTNSKPSATASGWGTTTSKDISAAGTYYVWARDAAGNVSDAASIVAYTISRTQGAGTTLTTRYDSTSGSTGTVFTSNMVLLAGTSVWASSTTKSGYNTPTLKHGSTTMTASGASFTVSKSETITSGVVFVFGGFLLTTDPDFSTGNNGAYFYNWQSATGTITRQAISDIPSYAGNSSGYGLKITTTESANLKHGGFAFSTQSAADKVFVTRIVAKIPVGYNIALGSNHTGDDAVREWLTPTDGTGDWETYVLVVKCGSTGTFGTTNFFFLTGGTAPSTSSPLTWYVAYAAVIDATYNYDNYVIAGAQDNVGLNGYKLGNNLSSAPTSWDSVPNNSKKGFSVVDSNPSSGAYYFWAKDTASNVFYSYDLAEVDDEAPTGTLSASVSNSDINVSILNPTDNLSGIKTYYYAIVASTAACSGYTQVSSSSYTKTGLDDGKYKVCIKVEDNVGNFFEDTTEVTVNNNLLSKHIVGLYNADTASTVVNNSITYYQNTNKLLLNDGFGNGGTSNSDLGNIRYSGYAPNNYIYFNCEQYPSTNCEVWRIVGVFTEDGVRKVKLTRGSRLSTGIFDNKNGVGTGTGTNAVGSNAWYDSRLMMLLNPPEYSTHVTDSAIYNSSYTRGLYYNSGSGTCYSGNSKDATGTCNFTTNGLKNDATRNMISPTTWHLGRAGDSVNLYADQLYDYERGTTIDTYAQPTWVGKVALVYASDWAYTMNLSSCTRDVRNHGYSSCYNNQSWLESIYDDTSNMAYTLSARQETYLFTVFANNSSYVGDAQPGYGSDIFPTVYLDQNVSKVGGTGTSSDPYQIISSSGNNGGPTCSITATAGSTTVTASYSTSDGASISYYGWDSSYSGTNSTTKVVDSTGILTYYVKDSNGLTGRCSATISAPTAVCSSGSYSGGYCYTYANITNTVYQCQYNCSTSDGGMVEYTTAATAERCPISKTCSLGHTGSFVSASLSSFSCPSGYNSNNNNSNPACWKASTNYTLQCAEKTQLSDSLCFNSG